MYIYLYTHVDNMLIYPITCENVWWTPNLVIILYEVIKRGHRTGLNIIT